MTFLQKPICHLSWQPTLVKTSIHYITAWPAFANIGCVEGFQFARERLHKELPPTCRNATRFDSFIFHPAFRNLISDMWVGPGHLFSDHSQIYARFNIDSNTIGPIGPTPRLYVPADWSELEIDHHLFERYYIQAANAQCPSTHIWSRSSAEIKIAFGPRR